MVVVVVLEGSVETAEQLWEATVVLESNGLMDSSTLAVAVALQELTELMAVLVMAVLVEMVEEVMVIGTLFILLLELPKLVNLVLIFMPPKFNPYPFFGTSSFSPSTLHTYTPHF